MTRLLILLFFFLLLPGQHSVLTISGAFAGIVNVENDVSVEASTGGNSAKPGETIEGRSSADVQIKTVINGEVVEDTKIHEEPISSTERPTVIEKKIDYRRSSSTSINSSSSIDIKINLQNAEDNKLQFNRIRPRLFEIFEKFWRPFGRFFERFF